MERAVRVLMGERLKKARQESGLSQADVAKLFNVRRQLVSAWECGRSMPTVDQLYVLAPTYGASLDYLVIGVPSKPVSPSVTLGKIFERPGVAQPPSASGTPEHQPES